jgi:hypothetical protein
METLADSHSSLASKVDVDIEHPLRDFAVTNRDMQAMTTIQGNLASMAKDIEKAQQRAEKLQGKGEGADANKVANATSDLENARAQWDSQAPYIFESLQALDETRVNQLRDLLTQFVTLEVDQVEKSRVATEQSLNVLLNVETADEIKTFALRSASRRPSESRGSRASMFVPSAPSRGATSSGTSSRGGPSAGGLPTIQTLSEDDTGTPVPTPPPVEKKSAFKGLGLKRLGTVMSRRQSKVPQQLSGGSSESPERKSRGLPFGGLRRNKESYSLEPPQEEDESSRRPRSPLRMGSETMEIPDPSPPPQLEPVPRINGVGSSSSNTASPVAQVFSPTFSYHSQQADAGPPFPVSTTVPTVQEPQRDGDGYSLPSHNMDPISEAEAAAAAERAEPAYNVNIRNAPIEEEGGEAALASMANKLVSPSSLNVTVDIDHTLQVPPPSQRRQGTVRGRRDGRNSAIITNYAPMQQSTGVFAQEAPGALGSQTQPQQQSQLPPLVTSSREAQPPSEPSSIGLFSSPSGAFNSSGSGSTTFSPFSPGSEPQSPVRHPAPLTADHTGDNQSIRSGRSTASHGMKHPELHEPGLSSSIVETISARFQHGQVSSSSLIGEIALAYNSAEYPPSSGQETIQIENFSSLEKVAPNPAFINQVPGQDGKYSVNLGSLSRTQIAFKYQLRHEDATTLTPLLITPAFRIETNQAMVIVSYSLHPTFNLQGRGSLSLSNLTIALTLEGARATSCQSKPVGTFAREKNMIFWQLGDVTLTHGGAPEKLLARFATESEATGGHVEGRWEISGEQAASAGSGIAVSTHADDPFADDDGTGAANTSWKHVPTQRKLTSGQYTARS